MKKIILYILFLFGFSISVNQSFAQQCRPCPELFQLTDSGCTRIDIIKSPVGGMIVSDSIRACKGSTVTYNINANLFGCNYPGIVYTITSVSNGTLVSSTGSQFTIQWGNTSPASVTIHYAYSGSVGIQCDGIITVMAVLANNPIAAFSISPNPACFNNPTTITFNSNASVNAVNYFWDFGDSFQGTGPNPSHNYTAPGTYIVTLIVTSPSGPGGGGSVPNASCPECIDSVQHTVVINALPGPPIECVATVCADETSTYCTSATGCTSYVWTVTGGTINFGQGTSCIQVTWGSGNPQGTINLVATGCTNAYCAQGTTVSVPIIPASTTIAGSITACINSNATYSLPSWPGTTYAWSLSGGGTITSFNTNTAQININWTVPGTWTVTCNYYDSAKNCGGTGTTQVTVLPSANITGNNQFCSGQSTVLGSVDQFSNAVVSTWSVSPTGTSFIGGNVGSSVTIGSSTPGTYTVSANPGTAACNIPTYIITVLPQPILNPIQGADSICAGQTYVYSVSSNTLGAFTWIVNNGSAVNIGTYNDSVQVTWGSSGPYTLSVSQLSASNNCLSNTQTFTAYAYPAPLLAGPLSVCADAVETYAVINVANHPFNWYITPGNLGTILTGQGTNQVQIKWHGSTSPGSSNTVYLHFSFCQDDSIAVTINEPVLPVITASGSLCQPGGVSLNSNATGSAFSWTCNTNPYVSSSSIATGITLPGNYTVVITNYNGTGCTVSATYNVPDIGRPVALISANNVLNYCLPNTPNMSLVAASGTGYSYQWYTSPGNVLVGTNSTLPISGLTGPASYSYYAIVTLNGCSIVSNILTINIQNCTNPGCSGAIDVSNITGCNPFTVTVIATAPAGGTVVGGTTTISYPDYPPTSGNTTMTYDSVGYKQITVCADIALPGGGTTRCCKDTVVLVKIASKFLANNNCGVVTLTDLSNVISPCTVSAYNWSVGDYPANNPVLPAIASFNNNTFASPVLTFTQSGQYIITQTITGCGCTVFSRDTISISVPNAAFTVANTCVGTPVFLSPGFTFPVHYWDFGDAATSYTATTSHAYTISGSFLITHTVTDANGCTNTATQTITVNPAPACNISYTGPTTFCFGQQLILNACTGYTGYQWFNNGVPVGTGISYTAIQTGNYYFTATSTNNCLLMSDTVQVTVNPAPPSTIITAGSYCLGGQFTMIVPQCNTCTYAWTNNSVPMPAFTTNQVVLNINPAAIGTHIFAVTVTNTATGCTSTGSVTVTFYNPPTVAISVAGNPPQLCSGNVYTLNATSNASSPAWGWTFNGINFVISTLPVINATAGGIYNVSVTDGITGCSATTSQIIDPSPDLSLFPNGCDTLCDTSHVFLPLGSYNGNLSGYSITWYNNAPPYTNVIGTGPSLNLASLPLGNNSISVIVVSPNGCADTSNNYNIYIRHCPADTCSCFNSNWDTLYWQPQGGDGIQKVAESVIAAANITEPPQGGNPIVCGQNIGTLNCNSPISIFASYGCDPSSCDSAVTYQLTGPVTQTGIMPFTTAGLPTGNYVLIITGKCGDSVCIVCDIPFNIICDTACSCTNSNWDTLYWQAADVAGKFKGIVAINNITEPPAGGNPITCGQNIGSFDCNSPINIFASYGCNPASCDSAVTYQLTGPVTQTGTMPFSTAGLPAGNYVLIITGYCGDSVCIVCDIVFSIVCNPPVDCCSQSHWQEGPFWINTALEEQIPVHCDYGLETFYINSDNKNCYSPVMITGTWVCPDTCTAKVVYELYDALNNLILSSVGSITIPVSLPSGSYTVKILAYCGDTLCSTCIVNFKKDCKCDCVQSEPISMNVFVNGTFQNYKCNKKLPVINCTDNVVFNGVYNCSPPSCPSVITYQLVGPVSTTSGTLPLTVSSLAPGSYAITIFGYCNGKLCKQCTYTFTVKCDTLPPPNCCPYPIFVRPGSIVYTVAQPDSNATVATQAFNLFGLTGVPLTEVRAEVMSYDISSNYNNECLGCKMMPFTWASIAGADSMGTLPPKITFWGGVTLPAFIPTGIGVYQNPREVVWTSSVPFSITGPLKIKFYLPPLPVIGCCILSGRICVKFTFRDDKCRECSAIACFNFEISENNHLIYVQR